MTFAAIDAWKSWNDEIESGESLPKGMSKDDKVFYNCGSLNITDSKVLPPWELATIETMEMSGHIDTQLVTNDPRHIALARSRGQTINPFAQSPKGSSTVGVLDSSGGVAIADKACRLALHKAQSLGVKFILGSQTGAFSSFEHGSSPAITGVQTKDNKIHPCKIAILACGGWTPSILPSLDGLCETTAGSVALIKLPPKNKAPELWGKYAPENFPTWMYKMRDGEEGGLYGFPRDDLGFVKIGYRGTKYTNPVVQGDGKERSLPATRWSEDQRLTQIPKQAMDVMQGYVRDFMPELEPLGIALTRVCWYNDSFDNHFVVDRVPGLDGVVVATGGSGHAFKYLPILGDYIVDVVEGISTRQVVNSWKWRSQGEEKPVNVLMEGSTGSRALCNVPLSSHGKVAASKL